MKVGIIGATGYTGEELLKALARHAGVQVAFVTSERQPGVLVKDLFPYLPAYSNLAFCTAEESTRMQVDLVFTCLHAGESAKWGKIFLDKGAKLIDLGSDFRFTSAGEYEKWYKIAHPHPELLPRAVYGLTEWHREEIKDATIVGNPGCYPTSVLMPLLPFVRAGIVADAPIIIDAKSGVSGAGKKATDVTHYVTVNENVTPYKVGRTHRHVGEMEKELRACSGEHVVVFSPHLMPLTRGMLSTIYVQLAEDKSKDELYAVLESVYDGEPFVQILYDRMPDMKMAQNSNFCFISLEKVPDANCLILFAAIDNLGKGASTQAVQNMNVMFGFTETDGLL
ncbi:N-acetyl-gamma-glutamyl-phosphate reductase [candidate division KSB1 bacterium]|nr:N-acetyl-gamma-glutamyl-phosphate reductase [candidate division KSB1 bacterium]